MSNRAPLKIVLAGDVMLGRLIDQLFPVYKCIDKEHPNFGELVKSRNPSLSSEIHSHPYQWPWGNTLSLFQDADFRLINLETSITTHPVKWPRKHFNYRMHPGNVNALTEAKIDFCNLANNHILDYCAEGMQETISTLDNKGIKHAGAGANLEQARKAARCKFSDTEIFIYGISDHYDYWAAGPSTPGIHLVDLEGPNRDWKQTANWIANDIRILRESNPWALVVVSIHMGPNYAWRPSRAQTQFAHMLIDNGVDIVHGHSSHHIKGVEIYNKRPIIYGAGDFVDDYAVDTEYRNDLGFAYQLLYDPIAKQFKSLELYPTRISQFQVHFASNVNDRNWLLQTVSVLSKEFGTKVEVMPEKFVIPIAREREE